MTYNVINIYNWFDLYDNSWGGAIQTLDEINKNNLTDEFIDYLNDIIATYENGMDATALNDFIWFECDDWLEEHKKEEDEEEEI